MPSIYSDENKTNIIIDLGGGQTRSVPKGHRDYAPAVKAGVADFVPTAIPKADIKAEAMRRITALMPLYKQRNNLAKAIEMIITHGSDPAAWPPAQQARQTRALEAWRRIEAIRAASDALEARLPGDFTNDKHWP